MCWKQMTKNATSVYDGYKCKNPLMMRKKIEMKDVMFRKDDPDRELFRLELAWDGELYVLLAALIFFLIFVGYKLCKWCKKA